MIQWIIRLDLDYKWPLCLSVNIQNITFIHLSNYGFEDLGTWISDISVIDDCSGTLGGIAFLDDCSP